MDTMEYCERENEVKQFIETRAGVKGLIDSGINKIPRMFIHPPKDSQNSSSDQNGAHLEVPLIDLQGVDGERRKEIINDVRKAAETWGFFQIVNHGIDSTFWSSYSKVFEDFMSSRRSTRRTGTPRIFPSRLAFIALAD